jgi:ABC-type polysaccharide/polyol phosphate export permease
MLPSPIFVPAPSLPIRFQRLVYWNPITASGNALTRGKPSGWQGWSIQGSVRYLIASHGFAQLQKSQKGLAYVV